MEIWQAIVLGIIQGITEFLPVSSSGHLILGADFLAVEQAGLGFEIALHLGTLLAVLVYFWRDLLDILTGRRQNLLISLAVATSVTGIIGYLAAPYRAQLDTPQIVVWNLLIFGILLWLVDVWAGNYPAKTLGTGLNSKAPSVIASVYLGLAQAIALVPGVSRSGAVITAARSLNMNKVEAARYAFLLSAPIVALTPLTFILNRTEAELIINATFWWGLGVSAIVGLLAIQFLLMVIKKISYGWFALYRALVAFLILLF